MDKKKRIILLENDTTNARALQIYLKNIGHEVIECFYDINELKIKVKELHPDAVLMNPASASSNTDALKAVDILTKTHSLDVFLVSDFWKKKNVTPFIKKAVKHGVHGVINLPLREIDLRTTLLMSEQQ